MVDQANLINYNATMNAKETPWSFRQLTIYLVYTSNQGNNICNYMGNIGQSYERDLKISGLCSCQDNLQVPTN